MGRPRKEPLTPLQKIAKNIGPDAEEILKELEAADTEGLNKRIAQSSQSIKEAKEELESNPNYVKVCEDKKALSGGLKDVKKRQNAIIAVCLNLRQERGAV